MESPTCYDKATLLAVLKYVRTRERSALSAISSPFPPNAAGALYDVAEFLAGNIDPDWARDDPDDGPFSLLRANA